MAVTSALPAVAIAASLFAVQGGTHRVGVRTCYVSGLEFGGQQLGKVQYGTCRAVMDAGQIYSWQSSWAV